MSAFEIAGRSFPAFSGIDEHVNKRAHVCLANLGAIPPGRYFIVDRPVGGRPAPLRNRTLENMADSNVIRHMLLNGPTATIRGSELVSYGEVWVR